MDSHKLPRTRTRRSVRPQARFIPAVETLEQRWLPSVYGPNVLGTIKGTVPLGGVAQHRIEIGAEQYALSESGDVMVQLALRPTAGSRLDAAPVRIIPPNWAVKPHVESTHTVDASGSVTVVSLKPGSYTLVVDGQKETFGDFELVASLVGDVDGDRHVTGLDAVLSRSLLNTEHGSPQYRRAADADLDGRITGNDHALLVRNLGAAAKQLSALTFTVNPAVAPAVDALPRLNASDPEPRTLSRLQASTGEVSDFVDNELYIVTNDRAALDAFVARWDGVVLAGVEPGQFGYPGLTNMYLVQVRAQAADPGTLNEHLLNIDPNAAFGAFEVSSGRGLRLLTAAAQEAAQFGTFVGVSWVGQPSSFLDRQTLEAPTGQRGDYTQDSWSWPHLGLDTNQRIGVSEAWLALNNARAFERLDNAGPLQEGRFEFAVFDNGFDANDDWRDPWVPFPNLGMPHGSPTPWPGKEWHGTAVVQAAAALPDNQYGAAGPGAPAMNIVAVPTTYDPFLTIAGLLAVTSLGGADIVNMSFHIPVPMLLNFTVLPFDLVTAAVASDTLIFAAAGNEGRDIDAEVDLFFFSAETFWYTPAENAGVIAVGGLGYDSRNADRNSNYGREDVDIFAPFSMDVGALPRGIIPGPVENVSNFVSGTSVSSPFAAGVAALIWAADPDLTALEVERILFETAHISPGLRGVGQRYVNAFGAVSRVLGDTPPAVELLAPTAGARYVRGAEAVPLQATAVDVEGPVLVRWLSNRDGLIGTGSSTSATNLSYGFHRITAVASDSVGQTTESRPVLIEIVTADPVVRITGPANGATFEAGPVQFTAFTSDNDFNNGQLPDANVTWSYDDGSGLWLPFGESGHDVLQSFPQGTYPIRVRAVDGFGGSAEAFIDITVAPASGTGSKPTARILAPAQGSIIYGADFVDVLLIGFAQDEEDGLLTAGSLVWTTNQAEKQPDGSPFLGTGTSLTVRLYTGGVPTWHRITLTVTDSDGNEFFVTRDILANVLI